MESVYFFIYFNIYILHIYLFITEILNLKEKNKKII